MILQYLNVALCSLGSQWSFNEVEVMTPLFSPDTILTALFCTIGSVGWSSTRMAQYIRNY